MYAGALHNVIHQNKQVKIQLSFNMTTFNRKHISGSATFILKNLRVHLH